MSGPTHLVLFDGDCAFCNGWVTWIRHRDRDARFRYAPLASPEGVAARTELGVPPETQSVVLVTDGRAYLKSDAAWRILAALPGFSVGAALVRLVPRALRDAGYDFIARHRHRLGMPDSCELPGK